MQDLSTSPPQLQSIDKAIVDAILSARIQPGTRLSENQLAALFSVSRTRVREAMMRLEARCIVTVSPRRGWFVSEPSAEEARHVYGARRIVEYGLLRSMPALTPSDLAALHRHLEDEKLAIASADRQRLTCLMGDFHIRLAEIVGNPVLTEVLRDLTARTILISLMYQSDFHALQSHEGHCAIVAALEANAPEQAAALAIRHLDEVEEGLDLTRQPDPLADLRRSLQPETEAGPRPAADMLKTTHRHTQKENP
ncbi:GntR family transcriptional regulator [Rhizobium sp. CSW-27]|uniref:GntR family transcriptional regulator n=1 Tax=Rhizobium sp. CSW-27 TaxID=2839985 RepID=UPI001C03871D|nr:GntR family transcriptional regulator [Rhizobium sp. CSW-27]MBT9370961.1 GntR family transcriptional regulator [Rhizobium sp. CSW-27]